MKGFNAEKLGRLGGLSSGFNCEILDENLGVIGEVLVGNRYGSGHKLHDHKGVYLKVVEQVPKDTRTEYEVIFIPEQEVGLSSKIVDAVERLGTFISKLEIQEERIEPPPSIYIIKISYKQKKGFLGSDMKPVEVIGIVMILDINSRESLQGQESHAMVSINKITKVYCDESNCEHIVCSPSQDSGDTCSGINEIDVHKLKNGALLSQMYMIGSNIFNLFETAGVKNLIKSSKYESIEPIKGFLDTLKSLVRSEDIEHIINKVWRGIYLVKQYYVVTSQL